MNFGNSRLQRLVEQVSDLPHESLQTADEIRTLNFLNFELLPLMALSLTQFQQLIRDTYDEKDRRRGVEGTFMWFMEEVGELAAALRGNNQEERNGEFADVLAWLATLANNVGVDLDAAVQAKYGRGCPGCEQIPCACDVSEKP